MKRNTLFLIGTLCAFSSMQGYDFFQNYVLKLGNEIAKQPQANLLVANVAESYTLKLIPQSGRSITLSSKDEPGTITSLVLPRASGGTEGGIITIVAINKKTGKEIATQQYERGNKDDLLEVDVGRAPNFPPLMDATGKKVLSGRTWKSGRVSPVVTIWTRESTKQDVQTNYKRAMSN